MDFELQPTWDASCTPVTESGFCGALNLRSPTGALAYRMPKNSSTPAGSRVPRYDAYPRLTVGCVSLFIATPLAAIAKQRSCVTDFRNGIAAS